MKKYNLIVVIDKNKENVLMCKRKKPPFENKFNFVGGKVENGEDEINAAYRELREETGITNKDIKLNELMTLQYHINDTELDVYAGNLQKDVSLVEEINKLEWVSLKENFFDVDKFAGKGNIGLIIEEMNLLKE